MLGAVIFWKLTFLGAQAPLELASVSQSVSKSQKSLRTARKRYYEVSRCREWYNEVWRGIKMIILLQYWNIEILRYWDVKILRYWDVKILGYWGNEI